MRIQKLAHFAFSLDSLAVSNYKNIFSLILTNKVCQKDDHLWKSRILAKP